MKRLIAAIALGITVALPVLATEHAATKSAAASVATEKSLDSTKGAFHKTHAKKAKLDCEDCHSTEVSDVLVLHRPDVPSGTGPVDRDGCLVCHKASKKPAYYGTAR